MAVEHDYFIPLYQTPQAPMVLAKGCDILDSLGIYYWLSSGTMLGLHREGGFIPHDSDLDIGSRDISDRFPEMDKVFWEAGFSEVLFTPYQRAYRWLGVIFDVYSFTTEGDRIVAHTPLLKQVKPAHFFDSLGEVEFEGRKYPTPSPVEGYLDMRYGPDWRTPKTQKDDWMADIVSVEAYE